MDKSPDELNRERIDALGSGNNRRYAELCNELGIEPEDSDLYESGMQEIRAGRERLAGTTANVPRYDLFVTDSGTRGIYPTRHGQTEAKIGLLREYFPERFGDRDVQPLNGQTPWGIDRTFRNIYVYAEKVVRENPRVSR